MIKPNNVITGLSIQYPDFRREAEKIASTSLHELQKGKETFHAIDFDNDKRFCLVTTMDQGGDISLW